MKALASFPHNTVEHFQVEVKKNMCRLLGVVANKPVDFEFSLTAGPKTLQDLGRDNPDGWGIGWVGKHGLTIRKEAIGADVSDELRYLAPATRSRLFLCHVRYATTGNPSSRNSHPFLHGNWLFAHNGCVDRDALCRLLSAQRRQALVGETDSEAYFQWLLQNIEHERSVVDGVRAALDRVKGERHTGLNFLLTDGESLYAFRGYSSNDTYYSLYWLERTLGDRSFLKVRSQETAALLRSKALAHEAAVLVCSERLTEEKWRAIPRDRLLVIQPDLQTVMMEMI